MIKKILLTAFVSLSVVCAVAQRISVLDTGRKWNPKFDALLTTTTQSRALRGAQSIVPDSVVNVTIVADSAQPVCDKITEAGYEATYITESSLVATIPVSYIPVIAEDEAVKYVEASRKLRPLMNVARTEMGVTSVTEGKNLETPYTGKGVVVGIIDCGFEYKHPAFTERVKRWGVSQSSGTLRTSAPSTDQYLEEGHATHVANIAGGGKVTGNEYYGIATGSDMVFMSSDLEESSVLKQVKAIADYAKEQGEPWVINMSFGGMLGPHDGSTSYDQSMSALTGEGGILVAAMGNSGGEAFHAYREITDADTPVYLYVKIDNTNNDERVIASQVWSSKADGVTHLTIKPVIVYGQKKYDVLSAMENSYYTAEQYGFTTGIDPLSKRQYAEFAGYMSTLLQLVGISSTTTSAKFEWEVSGEAGDSFHAWVDGENYPSSFAATGSPCKATAGDDEYLTCEAGASIPTAVAVASYNDRTSYGNYSWASFVGSVGAISNFSSPGPMLNDAVKPAIAAPGGCVISAYSCELAASGTAGGAYVAATTTSGSKTYYYGVMNGTSMATPAVTGTIALWLEANPKLTYDQLLEIFKQTGRRSTSLTGAADENGWNAKAGYGKIDAYEGLKLALEYAKNSGISETATNSATPVSLSYGSDKLRVLFNNNETFANIQLFSAEGRLVKAQHLDNPRCAEEAVISYAGLTPGIYLVNIGTTASKITRKIVVK